MLENKWKMKIEVKKRTKKPKLFPAQESVGSGSGDNSMLPHPCKGWGEHRRQVSGAWIQEHTTGKDVVFPAGWGGVEG